MVDKLMKLKPHYAEKIWGGDFLSRVKGRKKSAPIGELLEVSILKGQSSKYDEKPLSEIFSETDLTYCVKFIETTQNLSVQVHPDDNYANNVESSRGKAECWLILEANPGEGIYLGLKDGVTREKFLEVIIFCCADNVFYFLLKFLFHCSNSNPASIRTTKCVVI